MSEKVFVTGLGIVSAIGHNVNEVLTSLKAGRSGIGYTSILNTIYKDEFPVGEVPLSSQALLEEIPREMQPYFRTRSSLLGMKAVREALENARFNVDDGLRTGLISSTSVGGMDRTEEFFIPFLKNPRQGRLRDIIGHDCADNTTAMAHYIGIKDFVSTISTACSSAANAIMLGSRMIRNNLLDRVVVGGVDALTKFTLNGFNTLMILDRQPCRPFDETRQGLNLGEGAAFLVLESETIVKREDKIALCQISGYGNACDAFHQTASSPEGTGAGLAMRKALQVAGLQANDISYINIHGTGTPNNDLSEGTAIASLFAQSIPPFSSTKSFTGHTLGAAGALEAVISALSIQHDLIFPNLNFTQPMKELNIKPVTALLHMNPVLHVLSNSFGFGGNNTSLIFSKTRV